MLHIFSNFSLFVTKLGFMLNKFKTGKFYVCVCVCERERERERSITCLVNY